MPDHDLQASESLRELLALLGRVALRLAQAAAVTVGVVMAFALVLPRWSCACSTKAKAYQAAMKSDLRNLVTAQESYFAAHQTFAPTVEALGEREWMASTGVLVTIEAAWGSGFRASAIHYGTEKRCTIFVGDVGPPRKDAVEGQPICWDG